MYIMMHDVISLENSGVDPRTEWRELSEVCLALSAAATHKTRVVVLICASADSENSLTNHDSYEVKSTRALQNACN
jgi:hypothetical protein